MEEWNKKALIPKSLKEFLRSKHFRKPLFGVLIGGIVGFLYYHFVGCTTGSCPITSHPFSAILAGSLLGYLISTSLL